MNIQWFPGHMTKSMRMIEQNLSLVDAALYVLDARAIKSCFNPSFDKLIGSKKILYIINKSDLADSKVNAQWKNYFNENKLSYVFTDGRSKKLSKPVITELIKLMSEKIQKYLEKGVKMPIRAMVIGVPNSGKSTIINSLCGGKKTVTGNRPGVTKGKQWIRLADGIELLDTPGTLWNAFADQQSARHLAYIGSISDGVVDTEELSIYMLEELKELYPQLIIEKYGVDICMSGKEMLSHICIKKGCLIKGGEDTLRAANAVIDDFRKAKLGKISLERP